MASMVLTAIVADHSTNDNYNVVDQYVVDDFDDRSSVDLDKIEKKANRAIQGLRDLRKGKLRSGLREKIEEIAAEIAEQKIAEALANFYPPVAPTEQPVVETTTQEPVWFMLGEFLTPNFPNNYNDDSHNYNSEYFSSAPGQTQGLFIKFNAFDLEYDLNCYDYLKFQFWYADNIIPTIVTSDGQEASKLFTQKVCGKLDEVTLNDIPLITSDQSFGFYVYGAYGVTIRFYSDASVTRQGASLEIYAMPVGQEFELPDFGSGAEGFSGDEMY